jgi:parallel beta-helix repeat protein
VTNRYFDSVNGLDTNDGLTPDTAKKNYNPNATVDGDNFLFKRGTTQVITGTSLQWVRSGISDTQRTKYGVYGEAQVPYVIWQGSATSGGRILNAAKSKYIDFEDFYFDMTTTQLSDSVYCASQGGTETVGNAFRRCFFEGAGNSSSFGNGLQIVQETSSSAVWPRDFVIEDCEFFDNDTHGLIVIGARNIVVRRCKFYRNGANDPDGGHGFSSRWNRTDATSGWTNTSGTIWQRTLAAAETDVYYMQCNVVAIPRLRRTSGTQTAPAVGEFGVSAGVLYINLNSASNPSTQAIRYAWGRCSGLIVEGCESYENYWNPLAPYHEGHGYAFDDFTEDSQFLRNIAYNNQGAGFSVNRGDRNAIIGNVAYGNWQSAVMLNPCDDTQIINNTFYSNNAGTTGAHSGEVFSWGNSKSGIISNNILLPVSAYGITLETTDTGFTGEKNCINGYTSAAEKNAVVTGTISTAPALDAIYRPTATELKRTGATVIGKDYYGKRFYDPPNIGAVDDVTTTPRYFLKP